MGFAENRKKCCVEGGRIFHVNVNGNEFLPKTDLYKKIGCFKAYVKSETFTTDAQGKFTIDFEADRDHALVNFIRAAEGRRFLRQ
jgi:hypothetical protein